MLTDDPEVPQLARASSSHEEYDPAEPGLQQTFSSRRTSEEYDPERPVAVRAALRSTRLAAG